MKKLSPYLLQLIKHTETSGGINKKTISIRVSVLMNSLNLPNPKLMDIVVPKNKKHGVPLEIQMQSNGINAQQLKTMIDQKAIKLIDVRENFEIQRDGSIENSTHVPYAQIENFFKNIELPQPSEKFVLYCHTGQRTYLALQKLKNGNIYHLVGGILNWIETGEKVHLSP